APRRAGRAPARTSGGWPDRPARPAGRPRPAGGRRPPWRPARRPPGRMVRRPGSDGSARRRAAARSASIAPAGRRRDLLGAPTGEELGLGPPHGHERLEERIAEGGPEAPVLLEVVDRLGDALRQAGRLPLGRQ